MKTIMSRAKLHRPDRRPPLAVRTCVSTGIGALFLVAPMLFLTVNAVDYQDPPYCAQVGEPEAVQLHGQSWMPLADIEAPELRHAYALIGERCFLRAEELRDAALQRYGESSEAGLVGSYQGAVMGDPMRREMFIEQQVVNEPEFAQAKIEQARIELRRGNSLQASQQVENALDLAPNDLSAYVLDLVIEHMTIATPSLRQQLMDVFQHDGIPGFIREDAALGLLHTEESLEGREAVLRQMLTFRSTMHEELKQEALGGVLYAQGRTAEAIAFLEQSLPVGRTTGATFIRLLLAEILLLQAATTQEDESVDVETLARVRSVLGTDAAALRRELSSRPGLRLVRAHIEPAPGIQ